MQQYKRWKYRTNAIVVERPADPTPVVLFMGAFLYLAASLSRVEPMRIPLAMLFATGWAAAGVLFLTMAAFVTARVRDTEFGELRAAVVKFAAIYLFCAGVGVWTGGWLGGELNVLLFVVLTMWLFEVGFLDALFLSFCEGLVFLAFVASAVAILHA